VNRVRALSPHIGARGVVDGRRLTIWRARDDDGTFVPVEVQPEGGKRMPYEAYVRGLR
jgi:methionyl-tRNA formyltransferase